MITRKLFARDRSLVCTFLLLPALALPTTFAGAADAAVQTTVAKQRDIVRQLAVIGTITSPKVANLSAGTSGLVKSVFVDAGAQVAEGDVLLQLDASLVAQRLQAAQAGVLQAKNASSDARRRLREARTLVPQKSIAKSSVRDIEAEVTQDAAALQQAEADLAYQQVLLERHSLKAPFAGVVSNKSAELGEWVQPGQSVFRLVSTQQLRADFAVAEDYLDQLETGMSVDLHLNSTTPTVQQGQIDTIVPVADPVTRTVLVRVLLQEAALTLAPGMSVRATISMPTGRQAVVVPRDATLRHPDGRVTVWTVASNDDHPVAIETRVTLGVAFDGLLEIRDGLEPGATVVVQGNEALQQGQRIKITPMVGSGNADTTVTQ